MKTLLIAVTLAVLCFAQTDAKRLKQLLDDSDRLYHERKYPEAQQAAELAVTASEQLFGAEHPETATALINLAELHRVQRQYAKAEPLYVRALSIREKALGIEHPKTAFALTIFAELYRDKHEFAKAEPLMLRALAIDEKALGVEHPTTVQAVGLLEALYVQMGQYAKAEPLSVRLLAISEKAPGTDDLSMVLALNDLASLYTEQAQYAKAEPLYLRALAISENAYSAQQYLIVDALDNLAELYRRGGEYARAEPLYLRALAICERANRSATPEALNNLAALYADMKEYGKAEPLLVRAIAIEEKSQGAVSIKYRAELLWVYLETGAQGKAEQLLKGCWPSQLKELKNSLNFADEDGRRKALFYFKGDLSVLLTAQKDLASLRALGLQSVLESKGRLFEDGITGLLTVKSQLPAGLQTRLDELIVIRREEAGLVGQRAAAAEQSRMEELNKQDDVLSQYLTEFSPAFRNLAQTPKIEEVSAQLGTGALVELVSFFDGFAPDKHAEHYGAYLLTADGKLRWLDLGRVTEIDVLVARYSYAMNHHPGNEQLAKDAAREIDRLTLGPIRQALPGVTEFYMAADGELRRIPWVALRDERGVALIEKYQIHTLVTGRDLVRGAPLPSAQAPWVGGLDQFGKTDGKQRFPSIPGAASEAQAVADVMKPKPQILNSDQMTKSFLFGNINGPRILHLATHAYYEEADGPRIPLLLTHEYYQEAHGGLALKDANLSDANVLTDNDVAKLKLFGTQLVVLSACSTGQGEVSFADGITGLQRALTLAGARSQILTLWPVNDSKTKELMVSFYRNLFEKGMTKAEALRQAQLTMAHNGVDEYYWAPFVLYGDGGPLGQ